MSNDPKVQEKNKSSLSEGKVTVSSESIVSTRTSVTRSFKAKCKKKCLKVYKIVYNFKNFWDILKFITMKISKFIFWAQMFLHCIQIWSRSLGHNFSSDFKTFNYSMALLLANWSIRHV